MLCSFVLFQKISSSILLSPTASLFLSTFFSHPLSRSFTHSLFLLLTLKSIFLCFNKGNTPYLSYTTLSYTAGVLTLLCLYIPSNSAFSSALVLFFIISYINGLLYLYCIPIGPGTLSKAVFDILYSQLLGTYVLNDAISNEFFYYFLFLDRILHVVYAFPFNSLFFLISVYLILTLLSLILNLNLTLTKPDLITSSLTVHYLCISFYIHLFTDLSFLLHSSKTILFLFNDRYYCTALNGLHCYEIEKR